MAVGRERENVLTGNVFVVERDDVTTLGEGPQCGEIGVLADHHIGVTRAAQSSAETESTRSVCPRAMPA